MKVWNYSIFFFLFRKIFLVLGHFFHLLLFTSYSIFSLSYFLFNIQTFSPDYRRHFHLDSIKERAALTSAVYELCIIPEPITERISKFQFTLKFVLCTNNWFINVRINYNICIWRKYVNMYISRNETILFVKRKI